MFQSPSNRVKCSDNESAAEREHQLTRFNPLVIGSSVLILSTLAECYKRGFVSIP